MTPRSTLIAGLALGLLPLTSGCIGTVADVVTAPVRVASGAVDLATTSQSEADEKRGRDMRKRDERLGELDRSYRRNARECADGDRGACRRADDDNAEIERLNRQR